MGRKDWTILAIISVQNTGRFLEPVKPGDFPTLRNIHLRALHFGHLAPHLTTASETDSECELPDVYSVICKS